MSNEYLKETYQIKHSPYFLFLTGNKYYIYENSRKKEGFHDFITKNYVMIKKSGNIPSKVTKTGLYITYINRYLYQRLPIWCNELDAILYKPLELDKSLTNI